MTNWRSLAGLGFNLLRANLSGGRRPVFLSLFITNRCNLKCSYCFVSDASLSPEFLQLEYSFDQIRELVDEFYALGTRMIFMLGGEPLVHRQIKDVVDYIVGKGIYLHLITNGVLLEKKLSDILRADAICVSLDGVGEDNDCCRGAGVYEKAVAGLRAARAAGLPCRIHAVLTRRNLHRTRPLAELARELDAWLTISPPNYLGETADETLRISDEEYRVFWREFLELQREGFPIANSPDAIRQCAAWPLNYHEYIREGETFPDYRPTYCLNGRLYVALGADGTMYNCINLGCTNGPKIQQYGVRGAWERLLDWRPDCVSCASINCIETAMLLKLRLGTLREGFKFHNTGVKGQT